MNDLTKSSCVQAVEGWTHELASSFRHLFTSSRDRLARRSLGASSNSCRPATSSNGCGVTFHDSLNRVTTGNRVRRAAGEGLAQGRATAQPCLIGRSGSSYCERAGCNRSPREKASLGTGNQWTRRFKSEAIRPTKNVCHAKQITTRTLLWGWFSSLLSLPRMFHHQCE